MTAPEPEPPRLPESLAERYVLEQRLASGGSAEVWRGRDTVLDRPVAVKVLHRHLLADPTTQARLIQEARAAASLSHPGIVAVYDVAIDEAASAAVILELVEGESLADRIKREGALPPRAAVRIAAEVAEALAHAHERGVVHRDVKAANVLLGVNGEARLADFGIARLLEDEAQRLTDIGTIAGTLRYLAPEQLRGESAGPPADVYAVGVLLTEMVSGQPPYQVSSPVALADAQRTPPLAIEGAPPSLSNIVRPTLDPDPERRPSSAGALAAQLRSWLETDAAPGALDSAPDAPTLAAIPVPLLTAVPPVPSVPPVPPALTGAPPTPSERPRAQRLSPVPAAVIAGIVMFVALVLLLAAVTEPRELVSSPSPSPSASPTPSPSASPTPTPAPAPLTFSEAMEAFKDLVDRGEEEGLIEREAAKDLSDFANDIENAVEDGSQGDVNKAFRDLRRAIDEFGRDGRIADDTAASLQDAVNEIEAAAARER
ncbi:MAG TPA: serine/threonine-protein kinase [Pleomorphomonadaceae bacterium]|nr:serine/threonine-protein kinase [Pleomorphomonadaceae bacterium]